MSPTLPISGEYPDDWREIAQLVKDESDWTCARCSRGHDPSTGYTLTVHHFTGDKSNCERWNLMPLCQRCHLTIQGRVNPEIALLFEPSDWARPYIAGFYEAGRGVPGPTYDLSEWTRAYELTVGPWPHWAPTDEEPHREGGG